MRLFELIFITSLSGCAIHPSPEGFAGVSTAEITQHIRCESQSELRKILANYLDNFRTKNNIPDEETKEVGLKLRNPEYWNRNRDKLRDYILNSVHKEAREVLEDLEDTAIVYSYRFQMTEDNNEESGLEFTLPITNGMLTFGLGQSAMKQRVNERKFKVFDDFGSTLLDLDCRKQAARPKYPNRGKNYIYPIAGEIGMGKVLDEFAGLTLRTGLRRGDLKTLTWLETLTFTTTLTGSVTPKLSLSAPISGWRLTEASGMFSIGRIDLHEVAIGINLPEEKSSSTKKLSKKQKTQRKRRAQDDIAEILERNEQTRALREFRR